MSEYPYGSIENYTPAYSLVGFQDRCLQPLGHPSMPYLLGTHAGSHNTADASIARLMPTSLIDDLQSPLRRTAPRCSARCGWLQQHLRHVNHPRAQPFAEALGLRIGPHRRGYALAEDADDHEVERAQVG